MKKNQIFDYVRPDSTSDQLECQNGWKFYFIRFIQP